MKVTVEVFAAHACPHCASAQTLVTEAIAAIGAGEFDLRIVDVVQKLDHAVAVGVRSIPAIAINGTVAFTGLPSADTLRRALRQALVS